MADEQNINIPYDAVEAKNFAAKFIMVVNRAKTNINLYPKAHRAVGEILKEVQDFLEPELEKKSPRTIAFKANKLIVDNFEISDDASQMFAAELILKGIESLVINKGIDSDSLYNVIRFISLDNPKIQKIGRENLGLDNLNGIVLNLIDYMKLRNISAGASDGKKNEDLELANYQISLFSLLKEQTGFGMQISDFNYLGGGFEKIQIPENLKAIFSPENGELFKNLKIASYKGISIAKIEGRIAAFFTWSQDRINDNDEVDEIHKSSQREELSKLFFALHKQLRIKIILNVINNCVEIPDEFLNVLRFAEPEALDETMAQLQTSTDAESFANFEKLVRQPGAGDRSIPINDNITQDSAGQPILRIDENFGKIDSIEIELPEEQKAEIAASITPQSFIPHEKIILKEIFEQGESVQAVINSLQIHIEELESFVKESRIEETRAKYQFLYDAIKAKNNPEIYKYFKEAVYDRIVKRILVSHFVESLSKTQEQAPIPAEEFAVMIDHDLVASLARELTFLEDRRVRKKLIDYLTVEKRIPSEVIGELLQSQDWRVVRNMVTLIKEARRDDLISLLPPLMKHPEQRVRDEVISACGRVLDDNSLDILIRAFNDPYADKSFKDRVFEHICRSSNLKALSVLIKVFNDEEDKTDFWEKKALAIKAMGNFTRKDINDVLEPFIKKRYILNFRKWGELKDIAKSVLEKCK